MEKKDWKDLLGSQLSQLGQTNDASVSEEASPEPATRTNRQDLVIRFEKRNGKPATIVSHFSGTDAELKDLAASLKKTCGVGGSCKDDEILIQGDVRQKVADFLKRKGHLVKGDFKK